MNVSGFVVALRRDNTLSPYSLPQGHVGKFEHFLSGDEYYWLHQTQLQVSALRFEANAYSSINVSMPSFMLQKEHAPVVDMPKTPILLPQQKPPSAFTATTPVFEVSCNQNPITPYIKNAPPNPMSHFYEYHNSQTTSTQKKTSVRTLNSISQNTVYHTYKKHHVFIGKNEAELSINLCHTPKQEQTKLIQWIKNIMREKKLMLKQLVINGVSQ